MRPSPVQCIPSINDTKHTVLAPSPKRYKFGNTIVASLGTAAICFQTTSGELLSYDTNVIQLNVPALFGILLIHVANADVLVSSMQLRSPTWSADLREHGGHLYEKEKRNIVTSNYLETGVPDAVNFADKPVVNDDDKPGSAQNRPQKVANVISFSALPNMHTQLGHASAEAMLRFLEGGTLSCRSRFHHAFRHQTRNQHLHYLRALWIQTSTPQSSYLIRHKVQRISLY
jgi:hypothetical protein